MQMNLQISMRWYALIKASICVYVVAPGSTSCYPLREKRKNAIYLYTKGLIRDLLVRSTPRPNALAHVCNAGPRQYRATLSPGHAANAGPSRYPPCPTSVQNGLGG